MDKEELKERLQIAEGELRDNIDDENGCFDEIAQRIFALALGSGLLQEESSEDVEIQLDKSIVRCDEQEYIDGIYLSEVITEVHFTTSSFDGSEIYSRDIVDVEREDIIKVLKELIKMCKED